MAEVKTKENNASVNDFINRIEDPKKRGEAFDLLEIFSEITKEEPKMWGSSIIGFGKYHYKSKRTKREGDWMLTGFSPRKGAFSIYIMPGFEKYGQLLKKLGKHKISSGSCLYVTNLKDVDIKVLRELIKDSFEEFKKEPSSWADRIG